MFSLEVLGFCLFVLAYGYIIAKYVPKRWYVATNLLTAAGSLAYAWLAGASWNDLGLGWSHLTKGLLVGLAISVPVIIGIVVIASIPVFRHLFSDGPSKHESVKTTRFELAVRIPLGTALSEEIIFRSVLLGLLLAATDTRGALLVSSVLFGVWHIVPTLDTLSRNDSFSELIDEQKNRQTSYLLLTVFVTMLAGVGLACLRIWTGSIITPWIAHTSINFVAVLSGYVALKINGK